MGDGVCRVARTGGDDGDGVLSEFRPRVRATRPTAQLHAAKSGLVQFLAARRDASGVGLRRRVCPVAGVALPSGGWRAQLGARAARPRNAPYVQMGTARGRGVVLWA